MFESLFFYPAVLNAIGKVRAPSPRSLCSHTLTSRLEKGPRPDAFLSSL